MQKSENSEKIERIGISLPKALSMKLKKFALQTGRSVSGTVRISLEEKLENSKVE